MRTIRELTPADLGFDEVSEGDNHYWRRDSFRLTLVRAARQWYAEHASDLALTGVCVTPVTALLKLAQRVSFLRRVYLVENEVFAMIFDAMRAEREEDPNETTT